MRTEGCGSKTGVRIKRLGRPDKDEKKLYLILCAFYDGLFEADVRVYCMWN